MPKKPKILFVCTHNSARSQMAEGFARYYAGDLIDVDSAGTNPTGVNVYAVEVMNERGVDISDQTSKPLPEKNLQDYDYLITVCGDAREACPVLPSNVKTEHWPIPDPSRVQGQPTEIVGVFRLIRNQVEDRVQDFLARILAPDARIR